MHIQMVRTPGRHRRGEPSWCSLMYRRHSLRPARNPATRRDAAIPASRSQRSEAAHMPSRRALRTLRSAQCATPAPALDANFLTLTRLLRWCRRKYPARCPPILRQTHPSPRCRLRCHHLHHRSHCYRQRGLQRRHHCHRNRQTLRRRYSLSCSHAATTTPTGRTRGPPQCGARTL